MKILKLISATIFSLILLTSCGKNQPDSKQYGVDVKQNGFKPGPTPNDPVQVVYDTTVLLKPTWGQANHYATKRNDFNVWQNIGWVLLVSFLVILYGKVTEASWFPYINPTASNVIVFVLLAASISSFKWQSSSIKWNNDKWVTKSVYDKAMNENGNTKPIWDSLENNCKIVFGPYNCYEKK